jgi:hypothetical protein
MPHDAAPAVHTAHGARRTPVVCGTVVCGLWSVVYMFCMLCMSSALHQGITATDVARCRYVMYIVCACPSYNTTGGPLGLRLGL